MAVDYFLKLDGIEGESADSNHKNEIQIMSWSWGASQVSPSLVRADRARAKPICPTSAS